MGIYPQQKDWQHCVLIVDVLSAFDLFVQHHAVNL